MMGIAFIGAVCGNCDQVTAGADQEAVLKKIHYDLSKKFGAKGGAIVEGNMAVIQDAVGVTRSVDYEAPEFVAVETETQKPTAAASGCRQTSAA